MDEYLNLQEIKQKIQEIQGSNGIGLIKLRYEHNVSGIIFDKEDKSSELLKKIEEIYHEKKAKNIEILPFKTAASPEIFQ